MGSSLVRCLGTWQMVILAGLGTVAAARAGDRGPKAAGATPQWVAHVEPALRESEYHVTWEERTALPDLEAAWQAPNRAHNLRFYFTEEGVRVVDRTAPDSPELLRLAVTGLGREGSLSEPDQSSVAVAVDGARIELRSVGSTETFANDRAGLHHRLQILEQPDGEGPLVVGVSWTAAGLNVVGSTVEFATASGRRLLYRIRAEDATGAAVPVTVRAADDGALRILVEDGSSVFPIVVENLLTATPNTVLEGNGAGSFGHAVASGDVNGDGYADVVAIARGLAAGPPYVSAVMVFHGGPGGIPGNGSGLITDAADTVIEFPNAVYSMTVHVVAADLDVNGDGFQDVVVGSPDWDAVTPPPATSQERGAVWVFHGSPLGVTATSDLDADAYITCDVADAQFGFRTEAAGDVNGDGYGDLLVAAIGWSDDPGQLGERATFVFHGSPLGITATTTEDADTILEGNLGGLVFDVAGAGDLNGDGFDDVAIGLEGYSQGELGEGAVTVFYGRPGGIPSNPTQPMDEAADVLLEGNEVDLQFGLSVGGGGDVNGDGYADLLVGGYPWNNGEGAMFVFHGGPGGVPSNGVVSAFDAADTAIEGNPPLGNGIAFAWEVLGAGDVNGDGFSDVVATAPFFENGEPQEGAAFVFFGRWGGIPDSRALPVEEFADIVIESNVSGLCLAGWGNKAAYGDVNADGYSDFIVGASLYSNPDLYEGAVWIFHGGAESLADAPDARHDDTVADAFLGFSAAPAGDLNGDGYADFAVGAPYYQAVSSYEGKVEVFLGSPTPSLAAPDWTYEGQAWNGQVGHSVATAGDLNGDGFGDLVVGVPFLSNPELAEGRVEVFYGSAVGLPSSPDWFFEGGVENAHIGWAVAAAGDIDGDGYGDLIVGSPGYGDGQDYEGRAYVFFGSELGLASSPGWTFESNVIDAQLGAAVASAGDVNGDGFSDVLIGAPGFESGQTEEGAAYGFWGSALGLPQVPNWFIETNRVSTGYGATVAGAGDVNGDGFADAIVGAYRDSNTEPSEGRAYVYHGSAVGLSTTADRVLEMNRPNAKFGSCLDAAGDVNGDGFSDVVVGAPEDTSALGFEGRAYLFLGSDAGIAEQPAWFAEGAQQGDGLGSSVAGVGDHEGDGFSDIVVGVVGSDAGAVNGGSVELYLGNAGGGRQVLTRQFRGGDDPTPVQPWGLSYSGDAFRVRMRATSPRAPEIARLHAEACPAGVPFGDLECRHAVSAEWTEIPPTPEGVVLTESVTGLDPGALYHWRAHVLYAPLHSGDPGITPPPNPRHGPWRRLFGRASAADIRVDQPQGVTVSFIEPSSVVPEGGLHAEGAVVVHTSNGAATGRSASVQWTTLEGSAADGQDYAGATGLLELPIGTPDGHVLPVVVDLFDDAIDEPDENFWIELFEPIGVEIEQGLHEVWIADDDPVPELTANNLEVVEGAGSAVVELELASLSAFEIEVHYATQDGTAVAGEDYAAVWGVAVISPMTPAAEVTIPILDDADDEPEEVFTLELWDPVNAVLLTPVVTVTILDDDEPSLPFSDGFESGDTSAWSATVP